MVEQPTLPAELLPEVVAQTIRLADVIDLHTARLARAERRRIEKAEKKAKRLGAGKAVPSAETIVLLLSGEDRRRFREVLAEVQKTPPIPTRRQAAEAIFRMGLATLAAIAAKQAQEENLVQLAPSGLSPATLAAAQMGGGMR